MNEIYWITRLDSICGVLGFLIFLSIIALVASLIIIGSCDSDDEVDKKFFKFGRKIRNIAIPILIISSITQVFIPNSKEFIMISGVGGIIDYIKSNDKAKELPDKCIYAIDKFVDEYLEEEKK